MSKLFNFSVDLDGDGIGVTAKVFGIKQSPADLFKLVTKQWTGSQDEKPKPPEPQSFEQALGSIWDSVVNYGKKNQG